MIDIQHMNTVTVQLSKHNCVWVWQLLYSVLLCLGTTVVTLSVALSTVVVTHVALSGCSTVVVMLGIALSGQCQCHGEGSKLHLMFAQYFPKEFNSL